MLKFFGISNGLSKSNHTSAYFEYKNNLVLIDCSMDACRLLYNFNIEKYDNIYVVVTHTHSDHIGGIGMFAAYLGWNKDKKLNIIMPTSLMVEQFNRYMLDIEGAHPDHFNIGTASDFNLDCIDKCILTSHTKLLDQKCFGWAFKIDNTCIVYTGDTNTLSPFIEYIDSIMSIYKNIYLYTEISTHNSGAHLYVDDNLYTLVDLSEKGIHVFLMHIDDLNTISYKIGGTKLRIAPIFYA